MILTVNGIKTKLEEFNARYGYLDATTKQAISALKVGESYFTTLSNYPHTSEIKRIS